MVDLVLGGMGGKGVQTNDGRLASLWLKQQNALGFHALREERWKAVYLGVKMMYSVSDSLALSEHCSHEVATKELEI